MFQKSSINSGELSLTGMLPTNKDEIKGQNLLDRSIDRIGLVIGLIWATQRAKPFENHHKHHQKTTKYPRTTTTIKTTK